jgi:saccharopine dehydrogenase-like NADP-dependent oxidoreductase
MNGSTSTEKRNYRSLIIAGTGTIGTSLISLGANRFSLFDHIYAVDKNERALESLQHSGVTCCCGDISDAGFVSTFLQQIPGPSLFVNLCAGTNNVRIRKSLACHNTAYLDSCASMTDDPGEWPDALHLQQHGNSLAALALLGHKSGPGGNNRPPHACNPAGENLLL